MKEDYEFNRSQVTPTIYREFYSLVPILTLLHFMERSESYKITLLPTKDKEIMDLLKQHRILSILVQIPHLTNMETETQSQRLPELSQGW